MMTADYPSAEEAARDATAVFRSCAETKKPVKVPKKVKKAKREKAKRDYINELFLDLEHALDPMSQNKSQASILLDATQLLRALSAQIEHLKKENASLKTESDYIAMEIEELDDEKSILKSEVERLQKELLRIQSDTESSWHKGVEVASDLQTEPTSSVMPLQQPLLDAFFYVPIPQDLQFHAGTETSSAPLEPPSEVSRPHARYPSPSDSWPLELLSRSQREAHDAHRNGSSDISSSSSNSNSNSNSSSSSNDN